MKKKKIIETKCSGVCQELESHCSMGMEFQKIVLDTDGGSNYTTM
jgi:hypothetical protein